MIGWRATILMVLSLGLGACGGGGATSPAASSSVATDVPVVTVTSTTQPATAVGFTGMTLGATTHFQQGWDISALQSAKDVGAAEIRDEISWSDVERSPGVYDFSSSRENYLDTVAQSGIAATVVLQGGNANYDSGYTPYTDAGRAAFARFAVAVLDRFPSVKTIEIGNEYNSNDFVTGPVRNADYGDRQTYYALMLKAVHDAVKAKYPATKILGGATHSIPVGYLKVLFDKGALDNMDGIAIHPYTTEPEQFARQLDVLKTAMGAKQLPIYVTEYAKEDDSAVVTADYLVKMTAAMAASGVASADWYALRQEGSANDIWYKKVALSTFAGAVTQPGAAYRMMARQVLNQGAARRVAIDDFTYAYAFGDNVMVLWGAPRSFNFSGSAHFYNSQGQEIAQPSAINDDSPVVIVSASPIAVGGNLMLGATGVVADSFDQFDYLNQPVTSGNYEGKWAYYDFGVQNQVLEPMSGFGGGEISWASWTPFITDYWRRPFSIAASTLSPVDFGTTASPNVYKAVLRYTAAASQTVTIRGSWDVQQNSVDGVDLTVTLNGRKLLSTIVGGHYDMNLPGVALARGDRIDFTVGTNGNPSNDNTAYRVTITS